MEQIATIELNDPSAHDEANVIVRADATAIALALTHRKNGDLEVVMPVDTCRRLIEALADAERFARSSAARSPTQDGNKGRPLERAKPR
jgi:hypothetical protein